MKMENEYLLAPKRKPLAYAIAIALHRDFRRGAYLYGHWL